MPPAVALLLYTAYVLFLLRLERQQSVGVSAAAWIPTFWMLSISSKSVSTWLGMVGDNESGSHWDQFLLIGLAVAGLVVLARRRYDWAGALRGQAWLLALLAYTFLSTFWSDITLISLRRWVREGSVVIMALVLMAEAYPRQALESLLRRSAYILVPLSLMLIKYYPALGRDYGRWSGKEMWVGVTVQKNALGRLCLVSAFFLFWALCRRSREPARAGRHYQRWADVSVLLIALFLLRGPENAYSATSIGTIALGTAGLLALLGLRRLRLDIPQVGLLALVVFLIGFGASQPFLGGSNLAIVSPAFGRNETLTGRTDIWAELVPVVKRQPVLGCGFGSFWTTARRDFYQMSHGHNGYLDVLLELGVVGLAFYTAWLLSCARRFHGALREDYQWAGLAICLLLMALVYNATESALGSLAHEMTAVVVLASAVLQPRPVRADRRSRLRSCPHEPPQRADETAAVQSDSPMKPPRAGLDERSWRLTTRRAGARPQLKPGGRRKGR